MTEQQEAAMRKMLEALEESYSYVEEEAENAERIYGKYPTRQARIQGLKDEARKHWEAITAGRQALEQQPKRPQNCGTGYCSCIECIMEPEQQPAAWVGLTPEQWFAWWQVSTVMDKTEAEIDFADFLMIALAVQDVLGSQNGGNA